MKTFVITIRPVSGFGTPLKGDTLFGHICWQAVYDKKLFGHSIDELRADYENNPFIIISSAYPGLGKGFALKRPDMPLENLFGFSKKDVIDIIKKHKDLKKKQWMYVSKHEPLTSLRLEGIYLNDKELWKRVISSEAPETMRQINKKGIESFVVSNSQPHNTINRLTGTTGEGQFSPYSVDQLVYMPWAELVIFVGIREDIEIEQVEEALKRIGDTGFGKDASTGLGKFEVKRYEEINLSEIGSSKPNACYTLSPSIPNKEEFEKIFFTPFTRFGRHGDILARSKNPFKNPVIMADEGAVLIPRSNNIFNKPYIGKAVFNISKVEPNAVTQGYSLYIPVKVEGENE